MSGKYTQKWTKDCSFSIEYTNKVYEATSPFQHIAVYDSETFGRFWTLDGILMTTEKDESHYHEMITHPAFATHPNIKKVLIIGGGDGGTAREVLIYKNVKQVDMVEIDGLVVEVAKKYLTQTSKSLNSNDPRLKVYIQDGSDFVRECEDGKYDLIIIDSTDPISVGESLFTINFYKNCYRILKKDGILINQHESPFFKHQRIEMKNAHQKIKALFPIAKVMQLHQPTYESGHWLLGFASKKYCPKKDHKPEDWRSKGIDCHYYNCELHIASFALPTYVLNELES